MDQTLTALRWRPWIIVAATLLVEAQRGSSVILQLKMKIGYNEAAKLLDDLEAVGIVGPFEGPIGRRVLVKEVAELLALLQKNEE